jgi:glycosyltransferase involved in cell wall biosynthesis
MKLSVIIPVYNASAFIAQCFQTLGRVALPDTEVIFIDDGSADDSLATLRQFAESKPWVKVLTKTNGGAASARNAGIKVATGDYLVFLDADDTLDFQELYPLLQFSAENNLDICAYRYNYILSNGTIIANGLRQPVAHHVIDSGLSFLMQGYQPSSICVFLVKRNFIIEHGLFFVEGITHEDVEVSLKYFLAAKRVCFTEKIIYNYYQNEGSVTNQVTQQKKEQYLLDEVEIAFLMKQNLEKYRSKEEKTVIQKNYNSVTWNLIYHMLKEKTTFDKPFRTMILKRLRERKLYPVRGPLKTKFQNVSRLLMNIPAFIKMY